MRLDKYLHNTLGISRSQASQLLKSGVVTINGEIVKNGASKIKADDVVKMDGEEIKDNFSQQTYIMLHKPKGYVCTNDDPVHPCVTRLLKDVSNARDLHAAGRLDVDTTGLVLLTNDGQWSHRVTSPRKQCGKTYHVWLADPVANDTKIRFAEGIMLKNENQLTRPAELTLIHSTEASLTIHEGKYHQVKRMFAAEGNKVIRLHRDAIGALMLDNELAEGEYRYLTEAEIDLF